MHTSLRLLAVSALAILLTACGGPDNDSVIGGGAAGFQPAGGEARVVSGPVSFIDGATITGALEGSRVRVECGGRIFDDANASGDPESGIVDFDLEEGARLRRREGAAFELVEGVTRIRSGAILTRLVVFHGDSFLAVSPEDAPNGIDVHLVTQGDQLKAEVTKGRVTLSTTGATPKDLLFVTLEEGEMSVAKPGDAPQKNATDWFDTE